MNLTINIPLETAERIASALESIAKSLDRAVGPEIPYQDPKPFSADLWSTYDPKEQALFEAEARLEAQGYGKTYKQRFDKIAEEASRPPQPTRKPPTGTLDNP